MVCAAGFSHGLGKAQWLSNGSAVRGAHRGVSVPAAQDRAQERWPGQMEALESRECLLRKLMVRPRYLLSEYGLRNNLITIKNPAKLRLPVGLKFSFSGNSSKTTDHQVCRALYHLQDKVESRGHGWTRTRVLQMEIFRCRTSNSTSLGEDTEELPSTCMCLQRVFQDTHSLIHILTGKGEQLPRACDRITFMPRKVTCDTRTLDNTTEVMHLSCCNWPLSSNRIFCLLDHC
ncbi:uncharacterized protein LOC107203584 [Parus major]|uniref:uncharacterized protein LOC107203584 n=1 Tax=Parus major TaxID=9157 RepID=UPI0008F52D95|nr:uncharacterized protein LOC107203584 [Parus major]